MKTKLLAGGAALCAAAALSGCATLGASNSTDLLKQIDANFAGCDRHITFQAGMGVVAPGAQVSGSVDCRGASAAASGQTPTARAN